MRVYPCGSSRPNASNLNYVANSTVANAVVTSVNAGKVCIYTSVFMSLAVTSC